MCVDILNPSSKDLVLDPACGSGGFLFEAVRHSIDKTKRPPRCLGIDFSTRSVKVATLLAAALDDTTISVSKANSLDGRAYAADTPSEWSDFLIQDAASTTRRARSWGAWNRLGCDVLLTNPPFAATSTMLISSMRTSPTRLPAEEVDQSRALVLGACGKSAAPRWSSRHRSATRPASEFNSWYLRSWLFRSVRMIGVVGLHPYAFLPYTAVKTAILFLEKPATEARLPVDYPVLFA
jgi:type I restriction enzyme M protein